MHAASSCHLPSLTVREWCPFMSRRVMAAPRCARRTDQSAEAGGPTASCVTRARRRCRFGTSPRSLSPLCSANGCPAGECPSSRLTRRARTLAYCLQLVPSCCGASTRCPWRHYTTIAMDFTRASRIAAPSCARWMRLASSRMAASVATRNASSRRARAARPTQSSTTRPLLPRPLRAVLVAPTAVTERWRSHQPPGRIQPLVGTGAVEAVGAGEAVVGRGNESIVRVPSS